jgi:GNAT superfamily N-acetyltransferase
MAFQRPRNYSGYTYEENRAAKRGLVREGRAHGTIVYCGKDPVGWCQFGPKEELPRVDRRRGYVPTAENPWRITCLFVAPGHRRAGFAKLAVAESLDAMKKLGAKTIEAFPYEGKFSASFMWGGTPHMFEEAGFSPVGRLSEKSWIYSLILKGSRSKGRVHIDTQQDPFRRTRGGR